LRVQVCRGLKFQSRVGLTGGKWSITNNLRDVMASEEFLRIQVFRG
jgi:hypothetical protein